VAEEAVELVDGVDAAGTAAVAVVDAG